jgi:hypothetical protein
MGGTRGVRFPKLRCLGERSEIWRYRHVRDCWVSTSSWMIVGGADGHLAFAVWMQIPMKLGWQSNQIDYGRRCGEEEIS